MKKIIYKKNQTTVQVSPKDVFKSLNDCIDEIEKLKNKNNFWVKCCKLLIVSHIILTSAVLIHIFSKYV